MYTIAHCKQIKVISFAAQEETVRQNNMENEMEETERFFSVELKSKADLKNITLESGSQDNVLIEGTIGELVQAMFVEDEILEIVGTKGTMRINLKPKELKSPEKAESREVR
jgi:hypothetical protein